MVILMVVVQVVTFLAIVFIMKHLLHAESLKEVERLKKLKEEAIAKQRELQEQLDSSQKAFDQKMAEAEAHTRSLNAKSEAESRELRTKILEKAKEDAANIMKAAFNAKEKMREEIVVEMKQRAPLHASRIFMAVLSDEVRERTHKELLTDVIANLRRMDKSTFKTRVDQGEIASAYSLSSEEKANVESAFRDVLGYAVPIAEKKDGKISVGVVIRLGPIMIDGSLENRMRQAEHELEGSLAVGREPQVGNG